MHTCKEASNFFLALGDCLGSKVQHSGTQCSPEWPCLLSATDFGYALHMPGFQCLQSSDVLYHHIQYALDRFMIARAFLVQLARAVLVQVAAEASCCHLHAAAHGMYVCSQV